MKKNTWIVVFLIALAADLIFIYSNTETWRYISKPLVTISLVIYFISQVTGVESPLKKWIISGLIFSCLGDIFLLFQKDNRFFLFGLSAFLLAHLMYIFFFHQVRIIERLRGKAWLLLPIAVYYAFIITWLSPYLDEMKIPVRIYAVVISFMFMLALHMLYISNKKAGLYMAAGAFIFVISDSLLALDKYKVYDVPDTLIMLTYALAQFFIVMGAANYIASTEKERQE